MEEKKKCGWGGARSGAGRKKTGLTRGHILSIRFQHDFAEKIKMAAKGEGKTLAEFIEQHLCF